MTSTVVLMLLMLFALLALVSYGVLLYNTLVRLSNNVDKAWSNIDVLLKQRFDELPKLVEVCNSYMVHERETLEAVTAARAASQQGGSLVERVEAEAQVSQAVSRLFAVAEQYPELKANTQFLHLQQRISALESAIADRREFYNDSITLFNTRIAELPEVLLARQLGYRPRPLLRVREQARRDVRLSFANRPAS